MQLALQQEGSPSRKAPRLLRISSRSSSGFRFYLPKLNARGEACVKFLLSFASSKASLKALFSWAIWIAARGVFDRRQSRISCCHQ